MALPGYGEWLSRQPGDEPDCRACGCNPADDERCTVPCPNPYCACSPADERPDPADDLGRPAGAAPRIRWQDESEPIQGVSGYVRDIEPRAFYIYRQTTRWLLTSNLLGQFAWVLTGEDTEPMKAAAEVWLADFAASLGARLLTARTQRVVHYRYPPACGHGPDPDWLWSGDSSRVTCEACKVVAEPHEPALD